MHILQVTRTLVWSPSITGLRFLEVVMSTLGVRDVASTTELIHCWDPQARRMVCGAPGQIGSTKHVGAVTCNACLQLLGEPLREVLSSVR